MHIPFLCIVHNLIRHILTISYQKALAELSYLNIANGSTNTTYIFILNIINNFIISYLFLFDDSDHLSNTILLLKDFSLTFRRQKYIPEVTLSPFIFLPSQLTIEFPAGLFSCINFLTVFPFTSKIDNSIISESNK